MSNRPSARVPMAAPNPTPLDVVQDPDGSLRVPAHRVTCVRRSGGMWLFEAADIPADVWAQYVIPSKTHGPDLYGMCAGQAEFEHSRLLEHG